MSEADMRSQMERDLAIERSKFEPREWESFRRDVIYKSGWCDGYSAGLQAAQAIYASAKK